MSLSQEIFIQENVNCETDHGHHVQGVAKTMIITTVGLEANSLKTMTASTL